MLNQEEIKGVWYLADRPDISFQGILSFGAGRSPRLKGLGEFTEDALVYLNKASEITVHGRLHTGNLITLFNCNNLSVLLPLAGQHNVELNAHTVIFSVHLKDLKHAIVREAQVSYTVLSEWMGVYGHESQYDPDLDKYEYSYRPPKEISFVINKQLMVTFSFKLRQEVKGSSVSFSQDNFLHLRFKDYVSYEEVQNTVWKIQRFLTILVWQQMNISSFFLKIRVECDEEQHFEETNGEKWCRVFFRQSTYDLTEDDNEIYLIRFKAIISSFETMLQAWFRLEEVVDPVISILVANIGKANGFVQNNFLNLAQALEAFHRHIKQDTQKLEAEHSVRMTRILSRISDSNDKEWLQEKLQYAFEPSLRKRLKEIFTEHWESVFWNRDISNKNLNRIIDIVTIKRNYYTHYGKKLRPNESDFVQLIVLADILRLMLSVMMLNELGMGKDLLNNSISKRLKINLTVKNKENN